jgi:excisionase family DNA binding protein
MAMKLLTTSEVADRLRQPESTIRYWRHIGYGPDSFKAGRRVLYRESDVDAWVDSIRGGQAAGAAGARAS